MSLDRGIEIVPEPTAQERAAILAAFEELAATEAASAPGAWWEAGLRDGLEGAASEDDF